MRSSRNQLQAISRTFDVFQRIGINAEAEFEKTRIHFKSEVFAAVAVAKAPSSEFDEYDYEYKIFSILSSARV